MRLFAILLVLGIVGCVSGPRVIFVPSPDSPVRAGRDMKGKVYTWTGSTWELSRNAVAIPEGFYIWDDGTKVPTNSPTAKP